MGVVYGSGGGVYRVALDDGRVVDASLRGRLKREVRLGDRVVVGDRVQVEKSAEGAWTIEAVEPRRTRIVRRSGPGGRPKVVAANVDRVLVVVAADSDPPRQMVDRLLVLAESDGLDAIVVVNKMDVSDAASRVAPFLETYPPLGYPVVPVSARTGEGLEALRPHLCQGTVALVGPSGAGKSSLLNAVQPGLDLRTGEVSRRTARGRHTTVSARLIPLACGGLVADTPGFAEVGLWGIAPEELDHCFPELRGLRDECRYRGCAHLSEPDCAVSAALAEGSVDRRRLESYRLFREELEQAER
jgi:ribosome biogenesis GTPase